jgi:chemotaxis protein CheD
MLSPGFPFEVWLQPGEFAVAREGCQIRTLLGSCVSITLWHPRMRIGSMSHFLLWSRPGRAAQSPDARYGEDAIGLMVEQLARAQVQVGECEAKIFGGGRMFPQHDQPGGEGGIGRQNGLGAREMLQQMKVQVASESLFGVGRRTIVFDIASGNVWVRQVPPESSSEILV